MRTRVKKVLSLCYQTNAPQGLFGRPEMLSVILVLCFVVILRPQAIFAGHTTKSQR